MNLLLNPKTKTEFNNFVLNTPHALICVSPLGTGKRTIIQELSTTVLGNRSVGRMYLIEPLEDKKSIGIEQIRELKLNLRLKSLEPRVVFIPDAGQMTPEAQNSILKILENPPENTHIFLTVNNLYEILETIQSRSIIWRINAPSKDLIINYYKGQFTDSSLQKSVSLSGGRMGLLNSMLNDDNDHTLLQAIETAKDILAENSFERLCRLDTLIKDLSWMNSIIEGLELACFAALEHSAKMNNVVSVKAWKSRVKNIEQARQELEQGLLPKLVLGKLFLML